MLWSEFVSGLDEIRVEIRSTKNMKDQVPAQELLFDKLYTLIKHAESSIIMSPALGTGLAVPPITGITPQVANPVDETLLWTSDAPLPTPAVPIEVVERGDGEGRMVILSRTTPRISRPADLEEIFDEKDLGK